MQPAELATLLARQRSGWSLEQPFYVSAELYDLERRGWLAEQWYVLGHVSELPVSGSYIVRELLGESLLITRDDKRALHGLYNVCRHRGSRLCDADGRSRALLCPYHGWSYHLDGSLRAAAALPESIDKSQLGLRSVPIREIGGLILGSLTGDVRTLDSVEETFAAGLAYHGIREARIAARRSYPTRGNWKLVMENFIECYHCLPNHPEYCSVMRHVDAVARDDAQATAAWTRQVEQWFRERADPQSPLGSSRYTPGTGFCAAVRGPIGGERQTQSQDGLAVAPLMGKLTRFDGGVSTFRCEPFIFVGALNDHAVLFQFLPAAAERTEVIITWLVNGSATDAAVDIERMVWLWDRTTLEDKALIERNAAGVRSRAYEPGPYTTLESWPARLLDRYRQEMRARCSSA
jgi:phenylpropionate dioxygenase-like ring-hydroxylating dioxygenase large terminal subunit